MSSAYRIDWRSLPVAAITFASIIAIALVAGMVLATGHGTAGIVVATTTWLLATTLSCLRPNAAPGRDAEAS